MSAQPESNEFDSGHEERLARNQALFREIDERIRSLSPAENAVRQKPKLLFFHSLRSGPSRRAEGYLAQVLQRGHNHDTFQVHRIAQEESPDIVERFRVAALPTLLIVEGKTIRGRLEGPRGARAIEQFLLPWLHTTDARARSHTVLESYGRGNSG